MKIKSIRILVLILTTFFGFLISINYLVNEIISVLARNNFDDYFNVNGMIVLICSIFIVITTLPSFIYQIKMMKVYKPKLHSDQIIDDNQINDLKSTVPYIFFRRSNFIFGVAFLILSLQMLRLAIIQIPLPITKTIFIILSLIMIACAVLLISDAMKTKKLATTTPKRYT